MTPSAFRCCRIDWASRAEHQQPGPQPEHSRGSVVRDPRSYGLWAYECGGALRGRPTCPAAVGHSGRPCLVRWRNRQGPVLGVSLALQRGEQDVLGQLQGRGVAQELGGCDGGPSSRAVTRDSGRMASSASWALLMPRLRMRWYSRLAVRNTLRPLSATETRFPQAPRLAQEHGCAPGPRDSVPGAWHGGRPVSSCRRSRPARARSPYGDARRQSRRCRRRA